MSLPLQLDFPALAYQYEKKFYNVDTSLPSMAPNSCPVLAL
jgi:hypothetical protein